MLDRRLIGVVILGLGGLVAGCSDSSSHPPSGNATTGSSGAELPAQEDPFASKPVLDTESKVVGTTNTGILSVKLHDAPTPQVDEVRVTFDQVTVHASSGDVHTLPGSEQVQTVDLLSLQNGVVEQLGLGALPAGSYDQIRLHVTGAEVVLPGGQTAELTIPSGGTSGLKIGHGFTIPAGGSVILTLDWDVGAHLHKNKKKWILRPTITVESEEVTDPCANITFADPALEGAVREAINKPTGPITGTDVAGLIVLGAPDEGITDLRGIECLTSLTVLNLSNNPVTDLTPLAGLTNLQRLHLYGTQVSDLTPLRDLVEMTALYLPWDSQITSIAPLAGMVNLQLIQLVEAPLDGDFSAVGNWKQMQNLTLVGVGMTNADLAYLSGMTQIWRFWGDLNPISDVSHLSGLTSLRHLVLRTTQIVDTQPLATLTQLEALSLARNPLNNASLVTIGQLTTLWSLDLYGVTTITDITPLANLSGLIRLFFHNAPLASLAPLAGLNNLEWLLLRGCQVDDTDLQALSGLQKLRELRISTNQISDLTVLAGLPKLEKLEISENQITTLAPLTGHPTLWWLYIPRNQLDNAGVAPALSMPVLTYLNVWDNPVGCADQAILDLQAQQVTVVCNN